MQCSADLGSSVKYNTVKSSLVQRIHCSSMQYIIGKKKGQSVTNIVGYEIKDERDAKNLSCICCPNWRKTLGATVHIGLPLNSSLFIFTNSAPLGRVGRRVAMSVCVYVCAIAKHPLPEVV